MKKWIITTVLLICICAGAVAYAIIAPNFNKAVVAENTTENQEYTIKQPIKGCDITIFKLEVFKESGKELLGIGIEFTNTTSDAKRFSSTVGVTAYQDGVELNRVGTHDNNDLKIKDGASINVAMAYELRNNSDVTLDFSEAYMSEVVDSISYSLK